MTSNKKITLLKILFFTIIFIIINKVTVNAAIHSTDPKVTAGENVSITVTSTEALDNFNVEVSNSGGLEFISVSSKGITNGTKVGYMSLTEKLTTLATYTFKAPNKAGTYKVTFNINGVSNNSVVTVTEPVTNENSNNNSNENTNNSAENTQNNTPVQSEEKKSSNADLKNLGIKPNDFKGFKSGTTTYNVTVPNDVDKVTVYADKSDEKATVTGVGSKKLEVGKNALAVTVTAEDGTKKTYTINVTREEEKAETNTTNNTVDDKTTNEVAENKTVENTTATTTTVKDGDLVKLEVAGFSLSPKFSPDVYEYKLQVNQDVNDLDIKTEGANSDVDIEVVGNTSLQDGENTVTILVTNKKNNKTSTYQIIVDKTNTADDKENYAMQKGLKIRKILIGLCVAFILICVAIFIILKRKNMDIKSNEKYDYDDEDEERINLDEEEEFFNRVNKINLKKRDPIEEPLSEEKENKIAQEFESPRQLSLKKEKIEKMEEIEENDDEDEEIQYFRSSRPKKGKHF